MKLANDTGYYKVYNQSESGTWSFKDSLRKSR